MLSHSAKHVHGEGVCRGEGDSGGAWLTGTDVCGKKQNTHKKKQGAGSRKNGNKKKNEWGKNDKMMLKED